MTDDTVTLKVNGVRWSGWQNVRITRGVERASSDFRLEVAERWPEAAASTTKPRPNDACQLFIGNDLLISGWVDEVEVSYDAKRHSIAVCGRSRTGDLVDSSAVAVDGKAGWQGLTVGEIAAILVKSYNVGLVVQTDVGAPIPDFLLQQGETVFEAIDRAARLRALLVTDDVNGNLVITRAGKGAQGGSLTVGDNIKKGRAQFNMRNRFRDYIVKSQTAGNDIDAPELFASARGDAQDTGVGRPRTLLILAEGQADEQRCIDRAKFEKAVRAARSTIFEYSVVGWRDITGALWRDNNTVHVTDAEVPFTGRLLIAEVEYSKDEKSEGTITRMRLGPREAYDIFAELDTKFDTWKDLKTSPTPEGKTAIPEH